jgi:DNA-directed RNA polymerase sigma subunit (sigma70/sigma32)
MIDADREAELSARILSGDRRAIDELVVANLRFGIQLRRKFVRWTDQQGNPVRCGHPGEM